MTLRATAIALAWTTSEAIAERWQRQEEVAARLGVSPRHLAELVSGGGNAPENLHMLCKPCHLASERLTGDEYWAWFNAKRATR